MSCCPVVLFCYVLEGLCVSSAHDNTCKLLLYDMFMVLILYLSSKTKVHEFTFDRLTYEFR